MDPADTVIIRRSKNEDENPFSDLIDSQGGKSLFRAIFGQFNFNNMIEYSYLSLSCVNQEGTLVGYAAFNDSALNSTEFDRTINILKNIIECDNNNTLFLNFLIADTKASVTTDIAFELMSEAFKLFSEIDFIVWITAKTAKLPIYFSNVISEVDATHLKACGGQFKDNKVFIAHRSKFLPRLLVREAVIEDNDDLLPILMNSKSKISHQFDEFFLANLIQSQDDRNRMFVGVEKNRPCGVLATSLDINVDFLRNIYDLKDFGDIIIENVKKFKSPHMVILICGQSHSLDDNLIYNLAIDLQAAYIDVEDVLYESELSTPREVFEYLKASIDTAMGGTREEDKKKSCILTGFPRTAEECKALIDSNIISFDMIIELQSDTISNNNSNNNSEQLPDDNVNSHLTAVNAFKSSLADTNMKNSPWIEVNISQISEIQLSSTLEGHINQQLHQRHVEVMEIESSYTQGPQVNAFAVTFFAINEKWDSRSEDLLRVAFEDHPHLNYCLQLVPNSSPQSYLHKIMSCVKVLPGSSYDQSLFIIHRDAVLSSEPIQIKRYTAAYSEKLIEFLSPLGNDGEQVLDAAKSSLQDNYIELSDNPGEVCFAITLHSNLVGVVTLSRKIISQEDIEWIRANYQVDEFINYEKYRGKVQAAITHFIISPIFSKKSKYILREIMRYYGKTLLYYQANDGKAIPDDLFDMLPVRPRRKVKSQFNRGYSLEYNERPSQSAPSSDTPLYFITKRLLSQNRNLLPTRIVLIGGDKCAYSILESLCFVPHFHLLNLYLVYDGTPLGWESGQSSDKSKQHTSYDLLPSDEDVVEEIKALGFTGRVTLMSGRLTDIDRRNKVIIISDTVPLEYDILVVASAVQDSTYLKFKITSSFHPAHLCEKGIFCLGTEYANRGAISWLFGTRGPRTPGVVIYGSGINAWSVIGKLLEKGLEANRITWVLPKAEFQNGELGHEIIDETVQSVLPKLGINLMIGYEISDIILSESGYIYSLNLLSVPGSPNFEKYEEKKRKERERAERKAKYLAEKNEEFWNVEENIEAAILFDENILCGTLVLCNQFQTDIDVFSAINDSGIVYDGGIVVDYNFCTSDPFIFAAGSCSKYSRNFQNELNHGSINSYELGKYVTSKIFDAHLSSYISSSKSELQYQTKSDVSLHIPQFSSSKTFSMVLPGKKYFIQSSLVSTKKSECISMVTGGPESDTLCVVKCNSFGKIIEITYLGSEPIEGKNLGNIVGLHESYLSNACYSFDSGLIICWIEFLKEPWASVLFHDQFTKVAEIMKTSLRTDKDTYLLLDKIIEVSQNTPDDAMLCLERSKIIGNRSENISDTTKKMLDLHMLEFLRKNKSYFTQIFIPAISTSTKK